jgi:type VI secretion system protein ImpH
MATESRNPGASLREPKFDADEQPQYRAIRKLLDDEPFRVQFFQAVRLLQKVETKRKAVGYFVTPREETIRFSARTSLAFPPSEIHDLRHVEDGPEEMLVEFMGMCAAISVMPNTYTEFLIERAREKDHAMEDFLNIFNHRMISFFYRGWEKYRFFIEYEKSGEDPLSFRLLDILGLGTSGLRRRTGIPDESYLNYAGLLARHVRSAASLQQILEDYFHVEGAGSEQFAGTWRKLERQKNRTCFTAG